MILSLGNGEEPRLALFNLPNFGNFLVSYLKLNVKNKDFYLVKDLERWINDTKFREWRRTKIGII